MPKRRRMVYRYSCPACGAEFHWDKIKTGDLGFSMNETDRVVRRRKDSRHWDYQWGCQVLVGERWIEGVWCSWMHPNSACMSTRVDEFSVKSGEVMESTTRPFDVRASHPAGSGGDNSGDTANNPHDGSCSISSCVSSSVGALALTTQVPLLVGSQSSRGAGATRLAPWKLLPDAPWR